MTFMPLRAATRYFFGYFFSLVLLSTLAACGRKDEPVQKADSTHTIDQTVIRQLDSATGTNSRGTMADSKGGTNPGIVERVPDNDPAAQPPVQMPTQTSGPNKPQAPLGSARILSSADLATLHPNIPGYTRDQKLQFSRDVPGVVSKSTAIYHNANDPSQTIRLTIVDQDERYAGLMIKEIMGLEANDGKKTSVSPSGEVLTAYEVRINGTVGASSYIPSEHLATLSLVVGDHRLVQFREQPATSRDHLIEVAKNFDVKKFENAH
jgi:hypothetical protein